MFLLLAQSPITCSSGSSEFDWSGFQFVPIVSTTTASNLLPTTTCLTVAAASTLDLGGAAQQVASLSGGGSIINSSTANASVLTLSPTAGSTTFSGVIVGGGTNGLINLVMNGPGGAMVLTGQNTYSGGTQITAGTLQVGNANALGTGGLTANAGVVDLAQYSPTVTSLSGLAGTITNSVSAATLYVNQSTSTTFGGTL